MTKCRGVYMHQVKESIKEKTLMKGKAVMSKIQKKSLCVANVMVSVIRASAASGQ